MQSNIDIYVMYGYNDNREKTWKYIIIADQSRCIRQGVVNNSMSNTEIALIALSNALDEITQPSNILIHSSIYLGFKHQQNSKYKKLIFNIQRKILKAGHIVNINDSEKQNDINNAEKEINKIGV